MRLRGFLSREQVESIHRNALKVLAEVGVKVEHEAVRKRLETCGGRTGSGAERVYFPPREVEKHLAAAYKKEPEEGPPRIGLHVEVYQDKYLDPGTGELVDFDEEKLFRYFGLAKTLPNVNSRHMINVPYIPEGIPRECLPLAEKLYCWKLGISHCGSVHRTALCEPLLEMYRVHAAAVGARFEDVFGATGYMLSPLRLTRAECEQLVFFAERGYRMHIGNMPSIGGTAPLSVAGATVQALAEQIFLYLLRRSYWGDDEFWIGGPALAVNMRYAVPCFGRPEQQRVNLAFAEMAAFYKCGCGGLAGLTDAPAPSFEAGIHKATGVLATALATGHSSVSAGLLAVDKICSPVQMVLDDDLGRSLDALCASFVADDENLVFADIAAAAESGNYMESELTVKLLRDNYFVPRTWSPGPDECWRQGAKIIDVAAAREIVLNFHNNYVPEYHIDAKEEQELRSIIRRAAERKEA